MNILLAPYARPLRNGNVNAKNYPRAKELVDLLGEHGHLVAQIGVEGEDQVCQIFLKNLSFKEVSAELRNHDTFIAVDSYLQHHAWLLGIRGVVLWGQSDPLIFGHPLHVNLLKDRKYLRPDQFNTYEGLACLDEAFVSPSAVLEALDLCGKSQSSKSSSPSSAPLL